ncbi:dehydrogenase/reductase SDR family member 11-like [Leptopilina boulardi]|uniref:dehydrogenase/reductase SDR family member 11-like n=1 Tax=Leptopilina boulardi TaxID=63433 RepID=UPI0021F5E85F|nr:dehydrogenase/reductase SDR family member 11-like [Leptopilina boulardi]
MDAWIDKVALVTGASAGIGQEITRLLIEADVKVVGLARGIDKMREFQKILNNNNNSNKKDRFYPIKCDLTNENDILDAFKWIKNNLQGVDILINNAAVLVSGMIIDGKTEDFRRTMEMNVIAPAICIREAVRSMRERGVKGHIININSIFGHEAVHVPSVYSNLYAPSKFALTAMSQQVQAELKDIESGIRLTNLSPGLTRTDMTTKLCSMFPYVEAKDIAQGVIYALSVPSQVLVRQLSITHQAE